jgi:hypothetical protein
MAQTPIGGADLTKLRGFQSISDMALYVTPLVSVASGVITAVPAKYPFVDLTISWSGSTSDVSVGQMVKITNGTTTRSYAIVRKAVSGATLYIAETPLGAYGYATMIESPILVGDTVTVYNHRPLWGMYSRIDAKTKVFYKLWDVAYTSENEGTITVANGGEWQSVKLASGETTSRFTLPRNGVNTSFAMNGSISAYLWTLPSGVTLASGYAASDAVIEVEATEGEHLVKLAVTAGGRTHNAYLWLFVSDGSNTLALSDRFSVTVPQGDSQSRLGREMTITVTGDNLQDYLYPGAGFLLREWSSYNGAALSDGVGIDSFIGYASEISFTHDGNIGQATVKIESPMVYANRIVQAPQSLEEVTEATKWTECETVLSNPCGFAYYLITHHTPNLLGMHDFDAEDYQTPRRKYLQCTTRSLGAALQVVAEYLSGNIGSASNGTTVLRPNPLYLGQTDRDAIATLITFQEQDISAPLAYRRRLYNAYAEVRGGAFAYAGGTPKAFYIGRRWSQGSGSIEMPNFTVTVAQGLTEAKARIGHFFAEQNAEIQDISLGLIRNIDVIDPAYMVWAAFTVSASYDPYGLGFSSNRLLPDTVSREWSIDNGGIKKRVTVKSQGETFGQAGEELPVVVGAQGGWYLGTPVLWNPYTSSGMFGGQSINLAIANNDDGQFAACFNYYAANPEWFDLAAAVNGESINDFDFDFGSPFFTSGRNASQSLGVYVLTTVGTFGNIWYLADILRGGTAVKIHSITLSDSTVATEGRIACSETYPSLVIAAFKDGTGTRYTRSTDGGTSFGSLTRAGSAITDDSDNDNAPLGLAVDGQRQLLSAPDALNDWRVYSAFTASGSFSALGSSPSGFSPHPLVAIEPDAATAYATAIGGATQLITFDPASDDIIAGDGTTPAPSWRITGGDSTGKTLAVVSSGGNPGYCWQMTGPSFVNTDRFIVTVRCVTAPASTTITNITFDYYIDAPGSTFDLYVIGVGGISGSDPLSAVNDGAWHSVDWINDVSSTGFPRTATGVDAVMLDIVTGGASAFTIRIDNVNIITSTPFITSSDPALHKVTTFTGTPSWSDVSPSAGEAPQRPYDLAIDRVDPSILNTVTANGSDWYKSLNEGSSWSSYASDTDYKALYTVGNAILAGGSDAIAISLNGGDSVSNIAGNLGNVWNSIGVIKKVLAL